ncbi:MAG TPA: 2-hydroxychromene-2-carboxylate isomerase [Alphaproteobacteria bacterium]|nr:2-hydroxychromene-2-carboxylate isomerase [Alphaproteobacteria bacterium]
MSKTLEFFFDYGSPTSYLANVQIAGIAERTGAAVVRKPMLLGGVFKASGNQTPVAIPAKGAYMLTDMARMAKHLGVPFRMNPYFIINTLPLMRGAMAALEDGNFEAYDAAMWQAMWVDGENMGEVEVIGKVLKGAGLDPAAFAARIQDQAVKDALIAGTEEAAKRGAFGAPTMFIGDEMFFGSDRMDYVERALAA